MDAFVASSVDPEPVGNPWTYSSSPFGSGVGGSGRPFHTPLGSDEEPTGPRVGASSREGRQVSDTANSSRGRARCRPRWRGPSHHTDGPTCPESPGLRTASESTKHLADILDEPTWT